MPAPGLVRHVLLDADGVLQRPSGDGWRSALRDHLGERAEDLLALLPGLEHPTLTGVTDFPPVLARTLVRLGVATDPEQVYAAAWLSVETDPDVVRLASRLRGRGYGVHLASNQHARRAAHMETVLGYPDLLEHRFYSCALGVAKPDPAFFEAVLARLDAPADAVLFVDDSAPNVAGARSVGLRAEQWDLGDGLAALLALLAGHGVVPGDRR